MTRRPCLYTWIDAFCPEDVWYHEGDGFTYQTRVIETVGWCILQDRDYYVVAGTYDETAEIYCNVILIPRGCVRSVKELDRLPDDSDVGDIGGDISAAGHP